ncbi:MarR family transcriptional regulator [Phytomonospora sp. NPDC050363]|uniref:MarR family winged helix-turn-helix transcriptional regulator n=1 Tax=Phytomonospora sp. NPDC050363 TaxID=3155642 RepID=UPI0033F41B23
MGDVRWLDEGEQELWRAYLWSSRLLFEELDRQLQRDAGIPHAYYMILSALSEAPGRELTMTELAGTVRGSASRLSHAVSRLEESGWVCRERRAGDRRTTMARLTEEGLAVVVAAAPGHVETVRRLLFDALEAGEVDRLRSVFRGVLRGLDPEAGSAAARWSGAVEDSPGGVARE